MDLQTYVDTTPDPPPPGQHARHPKKGRKPARKRKRAGDDDGSSDETSRTTKQLVDSSRDVQGGYVQSHPNGLNVLQSAFEPPVEFATNNSRMPLSDLLDSFADPADSDISDFSGPTFEPSANLAPAFEIATDEPEVAETVVANLTVHEPGSDGTDPFEGLERIAELTGYDDLETFALNLEQNRATAAQSTAASSPAPQYTHGARPGSLPGQNTPWNSPVDSPVDSPMDSPVDSPMDSLPSTIIHARSSDTPNSAGTPRSIRSSNYGSPANNENMPPIALFSPTQAPTHRGRPNTGLRRAHVALNAAVNDENGSRSRPTSGINQYRRAAAFNIMAAITNPSDQGREVSLGYDPPVRRDCSSYPSLASYPSINESQRSAYLASRSYPAGYEPRPSEVRAGGPVPRSRFANLLASSQPGRAERAIPASTNLLGYAEETTEQSSVGEDTSMSDVHDGSEGSVLQRSEGPLISSNGRNIGNARSIATTNSTTSTGTLVNTHQSTAGSNTTSDHLTGLPNTVASNVPLVTVTPATPNRSLAVPIVTTTANDAAPPRFLAATKPSAAQNHRATLNVPTAQPRPAATNVSGVPHLTTSVNVTAARNNAIVSKGRVMPTIASSGDSAPEAHLISARDALINSNLQRRYYIRPAHTFKQVPLVAMQAWFNNLMARIQAQEEITDEDFAGFYMKTLS